MTITAEYKAYLKSHQWDTLRRAALRQAGYRCEKCGKAKPLQVHHLTYERIFNESLSDLQALCFPCHEWIHADKLKRIWIIVKKVWAYGRKFFDTRN